MARIFTLLFCIAIVGVSKAQTIGLKQHDAGSLDSGYVLFAPMLDTNTYLIDKCGKQVHKWVSGHRPANSCYLLPDGTLLRTGKDNNTTFTKGGTGGIVELIDWSGNVTWSYKVSDTLNCQHHDARALPNGNILILAWESKTYAEAIDAGRDPLLTGATVWSEQILEVKPTGTNTGTIVWEWHLWDHLVQDYDANQSNYGVISDNPKLLDINYRADMSNPDWIHLNAIDYNPTLDQIVLSAHVHDEIWVIDHSTTTTEAAGHTGGNAGSGGDIIYRWGNPEAYDRGTPADQKLFAQHNAHWIPTGHPFAGQIMIFNNGVGRPAGNFSTVEIIKPPINGFTYDPALPYLPVGANWDYNATGTENLYSSFISGAQQLKNGNVLICSGASGSFTEVTTTGMKVWEYVNPVNDSGIIQQGVVPVKNLAFRCTFYPTDFSGFASHTLTPGSIIENANALSGMCNISTSLIDYTIQEPLDVYPNPTNDVIYADCKNGYEVFTMTGSRVLKHDKNATFVDVGELPSGIYFLKSNNRIAKFVKE